MNGEKNGQSKREEKNNCEESEDSRRGETGRKV